MNKTENINGLIELRFQASGPKFYRLCKKGKGSNLVDVYGCWWQDRTSMSSVNHAIHKDIKVVIPLEYML